MEEKQNVKLDELHMQCVELHQAVKQAITEKDSVQDLVNGFDCSAYIKTTEGRLLVTNSLYEDLFSGDQNSVGRLSEAFLNETILAVSQASDAMIVAGCNETLFSHAGRDAHGRAVQMATFKGSLLGAGHSRMAILGVTKIVGIEEDDPQLKLLPLSKSWYVFSNFRQREKEIATLIARGKRVKDIASELSVSDKTVDNTRNSIMKKLSLDHPSELIVLMVRLQDSGYSDFGL